MEQAVEKKPVYTFQTLVLEANDAILGLLSDIVGNTGQNQSPISLRKLFTPSRLRGLGFLLVTVSIITCVLLMFQGEPYIYPSRQASPPFQQQPLYRWY